MRNRTCKYGRNTQLGDFDKQQNKYQETDGTLHTRERCESLKTNQWTSRNGKNHAPAKQEFTLEAVLAKLASIGVKVNLEELMKQ
jgi:hypothetical protein